MQMDSSMLSSPKRLEAVSPGRHRATLVHGTSQAALEEVRREEANVPGPWTGDVSPPRAPRLRAPAPAPPSVPSYLDDTAPASDTSPGSATLPTTLGGEDGEGGEDGSASSIRSLRGAPHAALVPNGSVCSVGGEGEAIRPEALLLHRALTGGGGGGSRYGPMLGRGSVGSRTRSAGSPLGKGQYSASHAGGEGDSDDDGSGSYTGSGVGDSRLVAPSRPHHGHLAGDVPTPLPGRSTFAQSRVTTDAFYSRPNRTTLDYMARLNTLRARWDAGPMAHGREHGREQGGAGEGVGRPRSSSDASACTLGSEASGHTLGTTLTAPPRIGGTGGLGVLPGMHSSATQRPELPSPCEVASMSPSLPAFTPNSHARACRTHDIALIGMAILPRADVTIRVGETIRWCALTAAQVQATRFMVQALEQMGSGVGVADPIPLLPLPTRDAMETATGSYYLALRMTAGPGGGQVGEGDDLLGGQNVEACKHGRAGEGGVGGRRAWDGPQPCPSGRCRTSLSYTFSLPGWYTYVDEVYSFVHGRVHVVEDVPRVEGARALGQSVAQLQERVRDPLLPPPPASLPSQAAPASAAAAPVPALALADEELMGLDGLSIRAGRTVRSGKKGAKGKSHGGPASGRDPKSEVAEEQETLRNPAALRVLSVPLAPPPPAAPLQQTSNAGKQQRTGESELHVRNAGGKKQRGVRLEALPFPHAGAPVPPAESEGCGLGTGAGVGFGHGGRTGPNGQGKGRTEPRVGVRREAEVRPVPALRSVVSIRISGAGEQYTLAAREAAAAGKVLAPGTSFTTARVLTWSDGTEERQPWHAHCGWSAGEQCRHTWASGLSVEARPKGWPVWEGW